MPAKGKSTNNHGRKPKGWGKMTQEEFNRIVQTFDEGEPMRAPLYYRALKLIEKGFPLEAHLLILATWNIARFKIAMTSFDLSAYEATLTRLNSRLRKLEGADLMNVDLNHHHNLIVQAFDELAAIHGIEFTGAAKMLHLLNRGVFVMWDRAIAGRLEGARKSDYASLEVIASGFWKYKSFEQSGEGYLAFLRVCQSCFQGLKSPDARKTLVKCIDECNYCTITIPLNKMIVQRKTAFKKAIVELSDEEWARLESAREAKKAETKRECSKEVE